MSNAPYVHPKTRSLRLDFCLCPDQCLLEEFWLRYHNLWTGLWDCR